MPGSVCVKIWYSLRLDAESKRMDGGDIAFNELVKECLFVHGWNGRTGRRGESSLLCPIMYKGDSIYDVVRKVLGFFDPPLSPLSKFYVLFVRKIGVFSDPPQCGRHIWKPPNSSGLYEG